MAGLARIRLAVGVALGVALLALAGCGRSSDPAGPNGTETSDLSWDQQALQSIGFSLDDVGTGPTDSEGVATDGSERVVAGPAASPSARGGGSLGKRLKRHRLLRFAFGGRALHGEAVVQTDDGTKTVVVQRGAVTAVDATSVTVRSTDGFTLTWSFGDPIHVIKDKKQVPASSLAVGATVGVAGTRNGTTTTATLVVVPPAK